MEYAIETRDLRKTYKGGIEALKGVSLKIEKGKCFGLLGPNGAGKSTLVKTLLSIVHTSGGSAKILGHDIKSPEARRKVGYLPEGHRFPQYLTARGVCEYFGRLGGMHGPELKKDIEAKLDLVGMKDWVDTKVSKFSKGMAQRIGVAQALLGDPEVVFLDEPTDGVDPIGRAGVHFVIRKLTERGATVFINSHLLSELQDLCDEVGILNHGELIQHGTVSEVTAAASAAGGNRLLVRVRSGPLPQPLWASLQERGATKEPDGHFHLEIDHEDEITVLIDELRKDNVSIFSISPKQMQLEQAFVEIIEARGGGGQVQR